jgi:hypothetical protein
VNTRRLHRAGRWVGWAALVAVVDLIARAFAYALAGGSDPLKAQLAGDFGGPKLVVLSLVVVTGGITASALLLALADMGVRERWALADPATRGPRPRISLRTVVARAVAVWVVGMAVFALVESYVHWRAGLGFHGIACLTGPVHRNVIPIIGALALVGSAAVTALAHLFGWMRRVVARLLGGTRHATRRSRLAAPRPAALLVPAAPVLRVLRARPPPVPSATC